MRFVRSALLWASTNPFLAERLPRFRFVRRAARRFMPGEEVEDALEVARELHGQGATSVLTLLGENVRDAADADRVVEHYLGVIERLRAEDADVEISVKLTQLGLDLGEDLAAANLRRIVDAAVASAPLPREPAVPDGRPEADDPASGEGLMIWVDMESSRYVDPTLAIFRRVREARPNVGICLQAYLYRTEVDLESLLPLGSAIRLVKGAYREPAEVAFPLKADVDENYRKLAGRLLEARSEGRAGRPVIATHDMSIVRDVGGVATRLDLGRDQWEIAMLYGIGTRDQGWLLERDFPLRILISYGSHWFPWYMRRLAERPANVWFVLRKMFAR